MLEAGGTVTQETLHYDPRRARSRSLRSKEEAHDYRYFPEPDLLPVEPSRELVEALRGRCPSCRRRGSSGWCATSDCPGRRPSRSASTPR